MVRTVCAPMVCRKVRHRRPTLAKRPESLLSRRGTASAMWRGMVGGHLQGTRTAVGRRSGRLLAACMACGLLVACARNADREADRLVAEGVRYAEAGDTAAALERFDRALTLAPEHPAALVDGGLAALLHGRPADARARLERYLADHPDEVLPRVYLAHALLALDDRDGAIGALQQAVRLGFRDLDALMDGGFGAIANDLRFIQLASLVAQRNGQRVPVDHLGRPLVGDRPVRSLTAPALGQACTPPASPANE